MRKEDGYIGMRVTNHHYGAGTIIDVSCRMDYDFLVEFDKNINGHDGFDWGRNRGRYGHCYWFYAEDCDELEEEAPGVDIKISLSFEELTE